MPIKGRGRKSKPEGRAFALADNLSQSHPLLLFETQPLCHGLTVNVRGSGCPTDGRSIYRRPSTFVTVTVSTIYLTVVSKIQFDPRGEPHSDGTQGSASGELTLSSVLNSLRRGVTRGAPHPIPQGGAVVVVVVLASD